MNDVASRKAPIPLKPASQRKRPSRADAEEAVRTPSGDDAPLPQIPAGETKH